MRGCRPLTDEEIACVLRALDGRQGPRNRALFLLGVRTGFRISELLSLRVRDVWQHGRVVSAVYVARQHMKKRIEGRSVPLHQQARDALSVWLSNREVLEGDEHLFQAGYGARESAGGSITRRQAWAVLKAAYARCAMAGHLGTHSMRKTFAGRVYQRLGHDLLKTQRALGHRSVSSTAAYLTFADSDVENAILGG
jgi:integrase